MVGALILTIWASTGAACDLSFFDRGSPPAYKGAIDNNRANFFYASDIDPANGTLQIWNYILNRHPDKGIAVTWEKAGITNDVWGPLPPGESACVQRTVDVAQIDSDSPIVYGTTDQIEPATAYVSDVKKLGATDSRVSTSYLNADGKAIDVSVQLSTYKTSDGIGFTLNHSPGFVVGIANLPQVLSSGQIEGLQLSAKKQDASIEHATYFEYTREDPQKAYPFMFRRKQGPNAKTDFLFFAGSSAKFGLMTMGYQVEKVSADVVIFEERTKRPVFATDMSLLIPTKK
jgi:hypothetical protein